MEEAADQANAVGGLAIQRLHGLARLGTGVDRVLIAGQAIGQVTQQEHGITFLQANGLRLAVNVQPAMALHHQMKAGPAHALGTGMPAAAIAAYMKQAGIELQAF